MKIIEIYFGAGSLFTLFFFLNQKEAFLGDWRSELIMIAIGVTFWPLFLWHLIVG